MPENYVALLSMDSGALNMGAAGTFVTSDGTTIKFAVIGASDIDAGTFAGDFAFQGNLTVKSAAGDQVVVTPGAADGDGVVVSAVESDGTTPTLVEITGSGIGLGTVGTATSLLAVGVLPTSASGLATGDIWSNAGVLTQV